MASLPLWMRMHLISFVLLLNHMHVNANHDEALSFFGDILSLKRNVLNLPIISDTNDRIHRRKLSTDNNQSNISYPVKLTISPSILTTANGFQTISIEWNGATMATNEDWIGIYSPPNSSDTDYLDFFDTYAAERGSKQYLIWNMRDNYQVRYFTSVYSHVSSAQYYELKGASNIAQVSRNQPLQAHLSLTKHSPNEMQLRWISSFVSNPMVQIGVGSNEYNESFTATHSTYDTSQMCASTASIISAKQFRDPGYIYTVIMSDLQANTRYFYRFGSAEYWSNESYFITSSAQGSAPKPFGFIMYGDQGTTDDGFKHIQAVENEIDKDRDMMKLVLHIGDLSYAWGNGYNWDKWGNMIASVASNVPYMITIGNHEYCHLSPPNDGNVDVSGEAHNGYHPSWGNFHDDSNGECGVPSYYRFDADICEDGNSIFWYSFNYESVHFIMLSSEHNYSRNTRAYNFLVNDLKYNINYTITPWIIVGIHRPLYQSEIYRDDNIVDEHLLELLEPIFYEYNVDMILAGHFHSYERTCEAYNYSCVGRAAGGMVHFTAGAAGWELDSASYSKDPYIVFRNEIDFGYGKFVVNDTHLHAQYITVDNDIIDELVLPKKQKIQYVDIPKFVCFDTDTSALNTDWDTIYVLDGEYNNYPHYKSQQRDTVLHIKFDHKWLICTDLDADICDLECDASVQSMDVTQCTRWKDNEQNIRNFSVFECYPSSPTPTEEELMDCVPSASCICLLHNLVCCDGTNYVSECRANCACAHKCRNGKCGSTVTYSIVGGCVVLIICSILFGFWLYQKWTFNSEHKYKLAFIEVDAFHDTDTSEDHDDNRDIDINDDIEMDNIQSTLTNESVLIQRH